MLLAPRLNPRTGLTTAAISMIVDNVNGLLEGDALGFFGDFEDDGHVVSGRLIRMASPTTARSELPYTLEFNKPFGLATVYRMGRAGVISERQVSASGSAASVAHDIVRALEDIM